MLIITSKTRKRIMAQPAERMKSLSDRRQKTAEKHHVFSVSPTISAPEEDIHAELDKQGAGIAEAMEANQELNRQKTKRKQQLREEKRSEVVKHRLNLLKKRDEDSGTMDRVRMVKDKLTKGKK